MKVVFSEFWLRLRIEPEIPNEIIRIKNNLTLTLVNPIPMTKNFSFYCVKNIFMQYEVMMIDPRFGSFYVKNSKNIIFLTILWL